MDKFGTTFNKLLLVLVSLLVLTQIYVLTRVAGLRIELAQSVRDREGAADKGELQVNKVTATPSSDDTAEKEIGKLKDEIKPQFEELQGRLAALASLHNIQLKYLMDTAAVHENLLLFSDAVGVEREEIRQELERALSDRALSKQAYEAAHSEHVETIEALGSLVR